MNTKLQPSRPSYIPQEEPNSPQPRRGLWLLLLVISIGIYAAFNVEDFDFLIEKDGKYELSPQRKEKLQKELTEIDNAEQYVIIATKAGLYPCYNCGKSTMIFLNIGEVWKYGVTRIGQDKRYGKLEIPSGLTYFKEYVGDYGTCLKLEKIKIYNYALLPENLTRSTPLIRPPGNKVDL